MIKGWACCLLVKTRQERSVESAPPVLFRTVGPETLIRAGLGTSAPADLQRLGADLYTLAQAPQAEEWPSG